MKQRSKIIIGTVITAVTLVALTTLLAGISSLYAPSSEGPADVAMQKEQQVSDQNEIQGRPPPTPLSAYGPGIQMSQAKTIIPYHIPTIGTPPPGVTLQRTSASPLTQTFALMYAPDAPPANATIRDFLFELDGIVLRGEPIPSSVTEEEGLKAWLSANPLGRRHLVQINGLDAGAADRDPTNGLASIITIYHNRVRYQMTSDLPLDDLIKVAESVNWKP